MLIIGRNKEQQTLNDLVESKRPEFLAVYGRRRVGKTYLIKEYFNHRFAFYSSGVIGGNIKTKLKVFNDSLIEYGSPIKTRPNDWFEAFARLKQLIDKSTIVDSASGKIVIFLDEVPWMDSPRSDFKAALDLFWNTYASSNPRILLIVCGSATSWVIDNIIDDVGGFYKRVTRTMKIEPFSLGECEKLLTLNDINYTRADISLCYMIFGGIPYYLNLLNRRLSLAQNINELLFKENGALHFEYNILFSSLFKNHQVHMNLIEKISQNKSGITRDEIIDDELKSGSVLSKALKELEQCGFIRTYNNFSKTKRNIIYQLIDPFTYFCLNLLNKNQIKDWNLFINTPGYFTWCGTSFEILCLNHLRQIKKTLDIYGVQSNDYAFKSKSKKNGCQIDLLIDRSDNVINLCEIKYTLNPFEIDQNYEKSIINKIEVFKNETKTKKAIFVTMISFNGIKHNAYSNIVTNEIVGSDLFI